MITSLPAEICKAKVDSVVVSCRQKVGKKGIDEEAEGATGGEGGN